MGNSKKTLAKDLSKTYDAMPVVHVQIKANFMPAKRTTRTQFNIDLENRLKAANLQTFNGQKYRFFDQDWNEYPNNTDFSEGIPPGLCRYKWDGKLEKYVKNKEYD